MSTPDNTLLGRCIVVYDEDYTKARNTQPSFLDYPEEPNGLPEAFIKDVDKAKRFAIASVLDQLAAEIAVMLERNPNLTPHQLITILRMEAAGELAGWEQEPA